MKSRKSTLPILTFALGLLSGIFLVGIYSFTVEAPASAPVPGNNQVTVKEANDMFKRYYNSATTTGEPFKGFSVNRDEYQLIEQLFLQDESLSACRVYMGKNATNENVRIVVGVDSNDADVVAEGIYSAPASLSDPCPSVCDAASPITRK